MAPLQGLKGLYPDPQVTDQFFDEGVLEAKANPIHPDHSEYGSQYFGFSGTVPTEAPFAGQAVYDGFDPGFSNQFGTMEYPEAGEEIDRTPTTHAAPYPRGILQQSWDSPDQLALAGDQLRTLHGQELGGTRFLVGNAIPGREEATNYTTDVYVAPNDNYLSADVPGQLRGNGGRDQGGYGGGNADTTQGYGWLSSYEEFNAGHSIRRQQHDRMPWDFTATHGEQEVPFMGRHPVEQMPLDGPDSPYFGQGEIDGANTPWEGRIGYPTPYQQPVTPDVVAMVPSADVWAWG